MADLDVLGESVDRLITVDVAGRGVIHTLYDKAREVSGKPLALKAAQALHSTVGLGDNVLITTGFLIPPAMAPETDGPLGTLVLSRILHSTLGAKPIIIAEKKALDLTAALAKSIGMTVSTPEEQKGEATFLNFPIEERAAPEHSAKIIKDFNPSALIAVEKAGRNRRGVYHNMRGEAVSERTIKADHLFQEAERRGVLTIGVGDGGNEIGMGKIADTIRRHVPYGAVCNCPCKAGIACETKADHLVVSSVSNWGAYGVAACLSVIVGKAEGIHSGEVERILLSQASRKGAVDGVTGENSPSVDGLSCRVHVHIVELLRELVRRFI